MATKERDAFIKASLVYRQARIHYTTTETNLRSARNTADKSQQALKEAIEAHSKSQQDPNRASYAYNQASEEFYETLERE